MKTCGAIASVVFGCAGATVAPAQSTFIMHFDSAQMGYPGVANGIEETPSGFLITGTQYSPDTFHQIHTFIRTIDQYGNFIGEREYWNNDARAYFQSYLDPMDPAGNDFASSLLRYDSNDPYDIGLNFVRINDQGDTTAFRSIAEPPTTDSLRFAVHQTVSMSDGGFAMLGWKERVGTFAQGWLIRLDQLGDTLWSKSIGPAQAVVMGYGLSEFLDLGIVTTGIRSTTFVQDDGFLIRYDSLENEIWRRQFGAQGSINLPSVSVTPDSCIVTWSTYRISSWNPPQYQVLNLRKWDLNGNLVWNTFTEARGQEMWARDMEVLSDGAIICGSGYYGNAGLWKFSSTGDSLWLRLYHIFDGQGGGFTTPMDVLPTSDGGFAMCGESEQGQGDPTPGLQTMFVIKTDSLGCVVPGCQFVGIAENVIGLENTLNAYPNPSSGQFTLELTLPSSVLLSGDLTLQVFDAQGRLVERRNLGRQLEQTIALDLTGQPTGLYSAHLSDGKRILTGVRLVVE